MPNHRFRIGVESITALCDSQSASRTTNHTNHTKRDPDPRSEIFNLQSSIFNLQTAIRNLVYRQDLIDGDVAAPLPSKAVTRRANNPDRLDGIASRLGTALQIAPRLVTALQMSLVTALQMERQSVPAGRALLP